MIKDQSIFPLVLVLLILITFFFSSMHCYCQVKIDVGHSCTVPVCDLKFGKFPQHVFLQNHPDVANELKRQSDNFRSPREGEKFILKLTTSSLAPCPSPPLPSFDSAKTCALTCTFSGTKVCFVCFCSEVPVSELSLELLLLQVVLPALLEQGHTRQWLKNVMHGWAVTAAYLL